MPTFYRNVDLDSSLRAGAVPDASTIMWWLDRDKIAQNALKDPMPIELAVALADFRSWFNCNGPVFDSRVQGEFLWAHATFDPVIMGSAYRMLGLKQPWSHRGVRDIRTLVELCKAAGITWEKQENRNNHVAIDDALYQVEYTRQLYQALVGQQRTISTT